MSLEKTSLRDLGVISLVQLNASRNYISDIDEEIFFQQSKLQAVDLSSNSLINIEPKTVIRNPSLEILSLSSNQHLRLPEEGPFLYSQSLRVLKLSDCSLYYLPPETFQELPNLQELYLSHNNFEVLNSLQSFGSLTSLDIGHNYLTYLHSEIFTALPKLKRLNLSHNSLSTLNITVMPRLIEVSSSVELYGNPWVCDCFMFSTVYSWCRNNSVRLELVCSSPPEFKEKSWSNCEADGCDDDYNTDIPGQAMMLKQKLPVTEHETLLNPAASYALETQIQVQENEYIFTYKLVSITMSATLCFLVIAVAILSYRLIRYPSTHKGSAQSDSEACCLSSMEK